MRKLYLIALIAIMALVQLSTNMATAEQKELAIQVATSKQISPNVEGFIIVLCYEKGSGIPVVGAKAYFRGCGVDISLTSGEDGKIKANVTPTETGEIKIDVEATSLGYKNIASAAVKVVRVVYPPPIKMDKYPSTSNLERLILSGYTAPRAQVKTSLANPEVLDKYNYGDFNKIVTVGASGKFSFEVFFPNKAGKYIIKVTSTLEGKSTSENVTINYTPPKKTYRKVTMKIGSHEMTVNGSLMKLENPLVKSNPPLPTDLAGNAFIECNMLMDTINAVVFSNQNDNTLSIARTMKNNVSIHVKIKANEKTATRNGAKEYFDSKKKLYPVIIAGKIYCPFRYITEALYGKIDYDNSKGEITVTIED